MKNLKMSVCVILAAALCAALTGCGKKSFDVNKTAEISFEGYDGYGVCVLDNEYDWINDVIDMYGDSMLDMEKESVEFVLEATVTYSIEPEKNLSNGDTVTITPKIDSLADNYDFTLTGKAITVTVEGLEEVEGIDPFDGVTVVCGGIAPNGTATVRSEGNDDISYTLDKNSGLSNGDTITVTAEPRYGMDYYAEEYGKVFSTNEKTFTVEGIAAYVTKIDKIPDDMKEKMLNQANDSIQANCASWSDKVSLKKSEFVGYYLLTLKEGFNQSPYNEIYCVYKMTTKATGLKRGTDGEKEETGEETYYTYYHYSNIMLLDDGTCSVDLSAGQLATNSIESDYGQKSFWGGGNYYTYKGYKDLDSMFNACVTKKIDKYTYESTVDAK